MIHVDIYADKEYGELGYVKFEGGWYDLLTELKPIILELAKHLCEYEIEKDDVENLIRMSINGALKEFIEGEK